MAVFGLYLVAMHYSLESKAWGGLEELLKRWDLKPQMLRLATENDVEMLEWLE